MGKYLKAHLKYRDTTARETESIEQDEPEEDWREPEDTDCEYWQSNCYGRG